MSTSPVVYNLVAASATAAPMNEILNIFGTRIQLGARVERSEDVSRLLVDDPAQLAKLVGYFKGCGYSLVPLQDSEGTN